MAVSGVFLSEFQRFLCVSFLFCVFFGAFVTSGNSSSCFSFCFSAVSV